MDSNTAEQTTVGKYLLDRLYDYNVRHIFGVPGDYVLRFDKAIEMNPNIRFINTTRENTAGYCADAYGRMHGMGVACITYGVGINIANALAQAYVESSPLVVISGAVGVGEYKHHPVRHHLINKSISQHGDKTQLKIFKNLTVDQAVINSAELAPEIIDRVLNQCYQLKKPVYIELPRDIVDQPISSKIPNNRVIAFDASSNPKAVEEALEETKAILYRAQQPIIWAGHEILRFGLSQELLRFAENFQIPIVSSLLGKTVIDEHHPLFLGVYQGEMCLREVLETINQADCLLMLGVMMNDMDSGIFTAKLDHTHRVTANQHQLTIGNHHYNLHLMDYIKALGSLPPAKSKGISILSRADHLPKEMLSREGEKSTIKHVIQSIQKCFTEEHILISDVGDCLFASADLVLPQNSFIACAFFASLGFGVPAAIGAQLADPKRRAIAIVGDGGFQMTAMELATAVRYRLDPIIIVLNNHGYGTERILLEGNYNDIQNWNYSLLPQIFGKGKGIKVETESEFEKALQTAIANRGEFHLIEVELAKLDFSPALHRLGELLGNIINTKE